MKTFLEEPGGAIKSERTKGFDDVSKAIEDYLSDLPLTVDQHLFMDYNKIVYVLPHCGIAIPPICNGASNL